MQQRFNNRSFSSLFQRGVDCRVTMVRHSVKTNQWEFFATENERVLSSAFLSGPAGKEEAYQLALDQEVSALAAGFQCTVQHAELEAPSTITTNPHPEAEADAEGFTPNHRLDRLDRFLPCQTTLQLVDDLETVQHLKVSWMVEFASLTPGVRSKEIFHPGLWCNHSPPGK